jgi:hypothetical protein
MDNIGVVKAYFDALDSSEMGKANEYLSENYQLIDFTAQPMNKDAMMDMVGHLKVAMPNLKHSLSNIRMEEQKVRLTVQLSGINSGHLDFRTMGIGVVPRSRKFVIFPNGDYEFTISNEKITIERDVSPVSPNRRISGMLKALGVNVAYLQLA